MDMCPEKHRLTEEYDTATAIYSRSVTELFGNMGAIPKAHYYEQLRVATEKARYATADARVRLERHDMIRPTSPFSIEKEPLLCQRQRSFTQSTKPTSRQQIVCTITTAHAYLDATYPLMNVGAERADIGSAMIAPELTEKEND